MKQRNKTFILMMMLGSAVILGCASSSGDNYFTDKNLRQKMTFVLEAVPTEKFEALTEEDAKKIYNSDRTNDIHMEIIELAMKIKNLAKEGIDINLDPPCVALFIQAKDDAWVIKQRSKAEIAGHVGKGKW